MGLNTWAGVGAPPPPENAVGLTRFTVEAERIALMDVVDEATGVTVVMRSVAQRAIHR